MKTKQKNTKNKRINSSKRRRKHKTTRKYRRNNIQKGGNAGTITNELNNELQDYYFDDLKNLDKFLSLLSTSSEMNIDDLLENMQDE